MQKQTCNKRTPQKMHLQKMHLCKNAPTKNAPTKNIKPYIWNTKSDEIAWLAECYAWLHSEGLGSNTGHVKYFFPFLFYQITMGFKSFLQWMPRWLGTFKIVESSNPDPGMILPKACKVQKKPASDGELAVVGYSGSVWSSLSCWGCTNTSSGLGLRMVKDSGL